MALLCCKDHRELFWKFSTEVAYLLALLTVVTGISYTASSPAPAPAPSTNKAFVTRNGSQLQLQPKWAYYEEHTASIWLMIVRMAEPDCHHMLGFFPSSILAAGWRETIFHHRI